MTYKFKTIDIVLFLHLASAQNFCIEIRKLLTTLNLIPERTQWLTEEMKCGLRNDMTMKDFQEKEYLLEVTPVMNLAIGGQEMIILQADSLNTGTRETALEEKASTPPIM